MPPFSTARILLGSVSTVRTVGYKYAVGFTDFCTEENERGKPIIWYSFYSKGRKQKHVRDSLGVSISRDDTAI